MTNAIHFILILLQYLAIRLIKFYQKHISPNKGFCCAYHKYTGGRSCSNYALTAVRRYGISALWVTFPKRLDDCKIAAIRLNKESEEKKNKKKNKCDCCDCLSCDISDWFDGFDGCSGCDGCSCDLSASPFFPLKWLYKIILKQRYKNRR